MKIFSDLHHEGLYDSFKLLFENRLKAELFRPIGLGWFEEGYWRIAEPYGNAMETVNQYLKPGFARTDGSKPLNDSLKGTMTLEEFKNTDIDYVIASIPAHFQSFARLIKDHKPSAKLICHYGNNWDVSGYPQDNVMASIMSQPVPPGVNAIFYHQEFDTEIFKYKEPEPNKNIKAFLHVFDGYPDAPLFYEIEKLMPDWNFEVHGATTRNGNVNGYPAIAEAIHDSKFVWHLKAGGDGYGHIIHNIFACGRPAIVKRDYYRGQLAEELMEDGVTCLEVDGLSATEIAKKIEEYSETDKYIKLCQNANKRFQEVVNFDREEVLIREFLSNLI